MRKKWFEIFVNLLFWVFTIWMITNSFSIEMQEIEIIDGVEKIIVKRNNVIFLKLLLICAISVFLFYTNFWNILQLAKEGKPSLVVLKSIALLLFAFVVYYILNLALFSSSERSLTMGFSWSVFIFYFTISVAYGISIIWKETERQKQQLALGKKQAELSLLRSQLHPHFLFNVLNNLLSMVDQKSNPMLAKSLDRLSGLLRYVVYDTVNNTVPVRKEIDFIKNFAELQALRFEQDEITFDLDITGTNDDQAIEPGIFIPFIENAFKYGMEPEKRSTIEVLFDLSLPDKIVFALKNPIHETMQNLKGNGTGIQSSKERLQLVYPNKHKIRITKTTYFIVEIEIETDESNHS